MRYATGEYPDCFQPLRLVEPRLQRLAFTFIVLARDGIGENLGGGAQQGDVVVGPTLFVRDGIESQKT